MDTPFKVLFRQPKNKSEEYETLITNFVNEERLLYAMDDENVPTVVENKRLSLEFLCEDSEARLYMDGLDTLPLRVLGEENDKEVYIPPTNGEDFLLFDNVSKKQKYLETHMDGYYPFIPGYYRIKVVTDNVSYYSWLKVLPKQINESQWIAMRNDIENTLHGLAQDLIHKNSSLSYNTDIPIPVNLLRKLYIIKKDYFKWIEALKEINKNPRMKLTKEYNLVPQGKVRNMDAASIRYRARHPESRDYVYSPKNVRSYDLLENQWIRKIITFIIKEVNELLNYITAHKLTVKKEIDAQLRFHRETHTQISSKRKVILELSNYEAFIKRVRSSCIPILQSNWMKSVKDEQPQYIPHALNIDHRYKKMYDLYRLLKNEEMSVSLDSHYDYYWKRTDLLYEIWGFLQVIKALQHDSVGFRVVKGWIFDTIPQKQSIQIPFLESGTTIEFQKDNLKVRLVYDEELPLKKENTSLEKPIFTNSNHNKPDARLDFYKDEEYIGSIMVDFKYRPLHFVWDSYRVEGYKQNDTMRQLISYQSNMNSPFLYNKLFPGHWQRFKTVHEVWAVYPAHSGNRKISNNPLDAYSIRLMEVTPEEKQNNLYEGMANAIQKVIDYYYVT